MSPLATTLKIILHLNSPPSKTYFYNTKSFFLRRRKIFVTVTRQPLNSYRSSTKRLTCTINIILLRSLGYNEQHIILFITGIIDFFLGVLQCKLIKAAIAIHIQNNFQLFGKSFHFLADFFLLFLI